MDKTKICDPEFPSNAKNQAASGQATQSAHRKYQAATSSYTFTGNILPLLAGLWKRYLRKFLLGIGNISGKIKFLAAPRMHIDYMKNMFNESSVGERQFLGTTCI